MNELVREVKRKGKHGIQLSPELDDIFILLFTDDVVRLSDSPSGLQNQLDILMSRELSREGREGVKKSRRHGAINTIAN